MQMRGTVRLLASMGTAVLLACVVVLVTVVASMRSAVAAAERPNIVLVVTDDLEMGAIAKHYEIEEAALRAEGGAREGGAAEVLGPHLAGLGVVAEPGDVAGDAGRTAGTVACDKWCATCCK